MSGESTGDIARDALWAWASDWYARIGVEGESEAYLAGVAAWRNVWRPPRVKALLLAESHVGEATGDSDVEVVLPDWVPSNLPKSYVRLVYCLGYGETAVCSQPPFKNGGTWQFWDLLGQVALGMGNLMPRSHAGLDTRLRWKIEVLEMLMSRGIWLEDASPIALYSGGKRVVSGGRYDRLVREGAERFVLPGVADDTPESIWVIGKGVGRALMGVRGIDDDHVISQPQDRDHARYQSDLARLCAEMTIVAPD